MIPTAPAAKTRHAAGIFTGRIPEKAFKGSFNVRFKDPELHKKAAVYAYHHNVSLNSVVEESVAEYLIARSD